MAIDTTLADLVAQVRTDCDDIYEPYKWADTEIERFLSEGQDVFCDRINVIPDEIDVNYAVGQEYVTRPAYITQVRDIFEGDNRLSIYNSAEWQRLMGSAAWRTTTGGVTELIEDMKFGKWRLYPLPEETGTITVSVYRRAKYPLSECEIPEITDQRQLEAIILYARTKMYRKQDADIFDGEQADALEARFYFEMDALKQAIERKQRKPGTVVYGGI